MKSKICRLLCLLLALSLLSVPTPAARAEEPPPAEESLIDEDYMNQWIADYLERLGIVQSWQDFSVGFCYTATGDCWFYNADVFMYSASLYKVPVCMLVAEKEAAGLVSPEDRIQGSTLEYLESMALIRSSNDCGHVLVSYMGGSYWGKCSDQSIRFTDLDEDYFERSFFDQSYYTARFMTQVMLTLYEGGDERFPRLIEYLLQAQPDEYMNLRLKDRWPVAQKYGAYDENNGYNNNHAAAVIYTPTPIVVVVMTRNVGDYQNRIAEVAEFLADYSLELDQKLQEREAREAEEAAAREAEELARQAAEEQARQEAEEQARREAEEAAAREAAGTPAPSAQPEPEATVRPSPVPEEADQARHSSPPILLWAILGVLVLLAIPVLRHALRYWRRRARSRR